MVSRRYRDVRNTGFTAGVVAPEFLRNPNIFRQALKTGENVMVTNSGSLLRRPGTDAVNTSGAPGSFLPNGRIVVRQNTVDLSDGAQRHIRFYTGGWQIITEAGVVEATGTGPWVDDDIFKMTIVEDRDAFYIVYDEFPPHTIERDVDTNTWSSAPFAFRQDPNGRIAAPFERFAERGITIGVSSYSGTTNVTFSGDVLNASYVGARFQIGFGAQVRIDTVTSPTTGTGTIFGNVFPTQSVTVNNPSSFIIGDLVVGDISGVQGQVVGIAGNVLTIVNLSEFTPFVGPTTSGGTTVPGETIAGPNGNAEVNTVAQAGTPSPTNIWFEEIISAARGYPRTATLHRSRLVFGGFPQLQSYIAASAVNAFDDFDVGNGDDNDAIIEGIGNNRNEYVLHLVSAEQLVVLTDERCLYVPEGSNRGFTSSDIRFDNIGPEIADFQQPTISSEGVIFIDRRGRVILLAITGSQHGTWKVLELSRLGYHLIKEPQKIVYSAGMGSRQERFLIILNYDGSLAVFTYPRNAEQGGWVLWTRPGLFHDISPNKAEVFVIAGDKFKTGLERFSFEALLDRQFDHNNLIYQLANNTFHAVNGSHVVAFVSTNNFQIIEGVDWNPYLPASSPYPTLTPEFLGDDFDVKVEPVPFANENIGRMRRRVYEVYTDVMDSGTYRVEGKLHQGYDYQTQPDLAPPLMTTQHSTHVLGGSEDATVLISQSVGEGAPFHLREVTLKIKGG